MEQLGVDGNQIVVNLGIGGSQMSYKNFLTPERGITGRASELKGISSGP